MRLLPIFVKMRARRVVVMGAGEIAAQKIVRLLACGAAVRVIAPQAHARVRQWAKRGDIQWLQRSFQRSDVKEASLVIGATSSPATNQKIFIAARAQGVLCNIVDDPRHCDFYFPAIMRRGDLQIAVSTAGQSPAFAQTVRNELQKKYSSEYAARLRALGRARRRILREQRPGPQRSAGLRRMAEAASAKLAAQRRA